MEIDWENDWWAKNHIPFHKDQVHPYLEEFLTSINLKPGANILVPLCGKSLDMTYLAKRGFNVYAIDLSPSAFEQFKKESKIDFKEQNVGKLTKYTSSYITYFVGDFFDLSANHLPKIDFVYDRASIVALPPSMRKKYIKTLESLNLDSELSLFVYGFSHDGTKDPGPPFTLTEANVKELFSEGYGLRVLKEEYLQAPPLMQEKEITEVHTKLYYLHRSR